ncbi:reticulon-4-interacting protein 1 homolog, mitochondrial-like [Ornithodoros turicata]
MTLSAAVMLSRLFLSVRREAFQKRNIHRALPATMKAWRTHKFGDLQELVLEETTLPQLRSPNDVLVKVYATSVNPLDVAMMDGYGRKVIDVLRSIQHFPYTSPRFPLILGRDFSGQVVSVGQGVKHFRIGDEVWGATMAGHQGSHAEYLAVSSNIISHKPKTLPHLESASFPYVALTAWAAIKTVGNLSRSNANKKRCLVIGGSGGVGTFAIQLLKSWNANVTATCRSDAVDLLSRLGADSLMDYTAPDFLQQLKASQRFDFILDCVGGEYHNLAPKLLHKGKLAPCVTVVSPVLKNTDEHGLIQGFALSACHAAQTTIKELVEGRSVRWAFFYPNAAALKEIAAKIDSGKISPVVNETFCFEDTRTAYHSVKDGHLRGKNVIAVGQEKQQ